LIIGYSIIHPGVYSRKDSLIIRGRTAIRLVCGTIPIFVVAGLIEGFITPAPIPELLKLGFAFVTLVMIVLYVVFPVIRRRMA
ncbi:MAG: stage II sporulation protein M, partial [Treponemataceae bacterium]|nr:stage II sporulation protein M [Treponemataceae bacterium]